MNMNTIYLDFFNTKTGMKYTLYSEPSFLERVESHGFIPINT